MSHHCLQDGGRYAAQHPGSATPGPRLLTEHLLTSYASTQPCQEHPSLGERRLFQYLPLEQRVVLHPVLENRDNYLHLEQRTDMLAGHYKRVKFPKVRAFFSCNTTHCMYKYHPTLCAEPWGIRAQSTNTKCNTLAMDSKKLPFLSDPVPTELYRITYSHKSSRYRGQSGDSQRGGRLGDWKKGVKG